MADYCGSQDQQPDQQRELQIPVQPMFDYPAGGQGADVNSDGITKAITEIARAVKVTNEILRESNEILRELVFNMKAVHANTEMIRINTGVLRDQFLRDQFYEFKSNVDKAIESDVTAAVARYLSKNSQVHGVAMNEVLIDTNGEKLAEIDGYIHHGNNRFALVEAKTCVRVEDVDRLQRAQRAWKLFCHHRPIRKSFDKFLGGARVCEGVEIYAAKKGIKIVKTNGINYEVQEHGVQEQEWKIRKSKKVQDSQATTSKQQHHCDRIAQ